MMDEVVSIVILSVIFLSHHGPPSCRQKAEKGKNGETVLLGYYSSERRRVATRWAQPEIASWWFNIFQREEASWMDAKAVGSR
jgi:hypothetical protein